MRCKRDHCGDGRWAALTGHWHHQHADPHAHRHHGEQWGYSM